MNAPSPGTRSLSARLVLVSNLFVTTCLAQGPPPLPAANPPPDHPEVYYSFLAFHDDFSRWLEQRNLANPAGAVRRAQAAARRFGVPEGELPKIALVSRNAAVELQALAAEMRVFIDQKRPDRQRPERAAFQQFEARRQQIIASAVGQLRTTLTAEGWHALHRYINEQHRLSMRQLKAARRPQAQ